jgi:hypothetical protein
MSISHSLNAAVFTQGNRIGFLNAEKGKVGDIYCRASRNADFIHAVIDHDASQFIYALSQETLEIFVFKTPNLFVNPEPSECVFQTKFSIAESLTSL